MNKALNFIEKLKNPSDEFSPIPFWFLNDELNDEEIVRQLRAFKEKGVCGVVLHPRIGIPESIAYMSDEFMHYITTAVETAAELDMKIVLYDEAMYPSGSACGLVAAANPLFASQCIILTDDDGEGKLIAKTSDGKYIMQVASNGRIRGIHYGQDDGEPNAPLASDLLSPEAVAKFIEITHERYYSVLKDYFGSTIIGFFTDEPSALGRNPRSGSFAWTWGFEDVIEALGGDLGELEGLFTGEDNHTVRLYRKAVFERENDVYYSALSSWCEDHGIALMGHPHRGDDIECERFFHIPGQDVVLRWICPEKGGLAGGVESAQAKCSSDAARIFGRRRNMNECYGACCKDDIPWNFSGGDLKWYTDWLGVRGVNMFIPHAFYYSVDGKRKDERPPDVGPNNIWWKYFGTISTYIRRISYLMTDSRNTARVCVLCENRNMPVEQVAQFYENQVEFNYVPYSAVSDSLIKDGKLCIGDNTYEYVSCDVKNRLPMLKKADSIEDIPYRDIYTEEKCPDLRCTHIVKDGVDAFFLTNEGEEDICTMAAVPVACGLISMDLWTGDVRRISCVDKGDRTEFRLSLGRCESILIVADSDSEARMLPEVDKRYVEADFELVEENGEEFAKTYRAMVTCADTDNLYLRVRGEEMAECFVNGEFAGFSLWNEHEFYISPYLVQGDNIVEIKMTGSAVNRFTDYRTEYGLTEV